MLFSANIVQLYLASESKIGMKDIKSKDAHVRLEKINVKSGDETYEDLTVNADSVWRGFQFKSCLIIITF